MSADTKTKKRKSGDDVALTTAKKAKTAKSSARQEPLKSALKKPKPQATVAPAAAAVLKKTQKPATKSKSADIKATSKQTKKKPQEPISFADAEDDIDDDDDGGAALTADQTAALVAGFSSDESDGEEGADADQDSGLDISTLPPAPTSKSLAASAATDDPESTPGVIYLGRLPHGFYEAQLRAYFTQFGAVTHLRLARNRRTGRSQHYAFVEFASAAVAEIAAKTMDKYLLFGHVLQARIVPRDAVKENIWVQSRTPARPTPHNKLERGQLRRSMLRSGWEKRIGKEEARRAAKAEALAALGYEFEMPAVKAVGEVPVRAKKDEGAKAVAEKQGKLVETARAAEGDNEDGKQNEKPKKKKNKNGNSGKSIEVKGVVSAEPDKLAAVDKTTTKKRKPSASDASGKSRKKAAKALGA